MSGAFSTGFSAAYDTVTTGPGPWVPGDPWPSTTPGGAALPAWSGYIRLWVLLEIAAGYPFRMGPDPNDRLNAGNVMSSAAAELGGPVVLSLPVTSGLWVDVSCDVTDLKIGCGSSAAAGLLSKAEAGTLTAELYDPTGKYDPLNPDSPFALSGRSRLVPGQRCLAFCEVVDDPAAATVTVTQYPLFAGTVDRWSEEWTVEPSDRRGKVQATDLTKNLVKMDRDEQAPYGAGHTTTQRIAHIAVYFGVPLPTRVGPAPAPGRQLDATTMAQSAWELLNRTIDDELGFLWIAPHLTEKGGHVTWTTREAWTWLGDVPVDISIGCGGPGFHDIAVNAVPAAFDASLINAVYAARTGGTNQTVTNTTSVDRWGEQSYNRTDLGLYTDTLVAIWAQDFVNLSAFPRSSIDRLTLAPRVDPAPWAAWQAVLAVQLILHVIRVVYASERFDYTVDTDVRLVGYHHDITAERWEVEWRTVSANMASGATVFTIGASARCRLDAGNVLG